MDTKTNPTPTPSSDKATPLPGDLAKLISAQTIEITDEELAQLDESTRAYWAWKRATFNSPMRLPLAKIAWDAGVEYGRRSAPSERIRACAEDSKRLDKLAAMSVTSRLEAVSRTSPCEEGTPNDLRSAIDSMAAPPASPGGASR